VKESPHDNIGLLWHQHPRATNSLTKACALGYICYFPACWLVLNNHLLSPPPFPTLPHPTLLFFHTIKTTTLINETPKMADEQPSAGTASAASPKKHKDDFTVGGPKADDSIELSASEQGAERDWQFLMLIAFFLLIPYAGTLVVKTLYIVLLIPIIVLRYLLTDDTGFPLVFLLLVAAVYGAYSIIPILLRPPVEKKSTHPGDSALMKVGNYQLIHHDGCQLTSSQYPKTIARLKSMGYTYVTTIEGLQETSPVIGADGKSHCPVIIAVVKPVTSNEGPRVNDNKTTVEAGNYSSHSDVAPGGIQGDLPPQDKPVAGPLDTSHVLGESMLATDIHTKAIVKEEAVAAEGVPASKGSAETPLSSDESELCEDQTTEHDASEHVTGDFVQPYRLKPITPEELDRMTKAHGNISFCIGPLWVAEAMQIPDVRSYYLDFEDKGKVPADIEPRPISADGKDIDFMLECLGDKVPAAIQRLLPDNVDILHQTRNGKTGSNMHMAELTERYFQEYHRLPNLQAVRLFEQERTRRQRFELVPGVGETPESRQAFDTLPGVEMTQERFDLLPEMDEFSMYRNFLTNDQEVKLGNADYLESVHARDDEVKAGDDKVHPKDDEEEPKVLNRLKNHPDHDGAALPNLVLPWLDGIDELGLYEPNAHLPCDCGKAALAVHSESRHMVEPGLYFCRPDGYEAPQLTLLSESALREDRQRKQLEDNDPSAPVGYMRTQQIYQICDLHAITTNKPYVLTDGIDDLNEALVTTGDGLPVPGFWKLTKYPPGFTMPFGFLDFEYNGRPPRCRHGNLHPPFVDHCMLCFPTGEHDGDCSECDGHEHASALKLAGTEDNGMDAAGEQWDRHQLKKIRAAAIWEKKIADHMDNTWPLPHYRPWGGWW
jgi:hypothetical protein